MSDAKTTKRKSTKATAAKKEPHEAFLEAGENFCRALQEDGQEAHGNLVSAWQKQQRELWAMQLGAQKRADELRHEYWSALQQATGEDTVRIYQESAQKYQDGLLAIQEKFQQGWEDSGTSNQKALTELQEGFQESRISAFIDFKHACKTAWSDLDPDTLTCESLAAIGQVLMTGAVIMHGS